MFVCLCFPPPLLSIFYAVCVKSKENRWLVLPGTSCVILLRIYVSFRWSLKFFFCCNFIFIFHLMHVFHAPNLSYPWFNHHNTGQVGWSSHTSGSFFIGAWSLRFFMFYSVSAGKCLNIRSFQTQSISVLSCDVFWGWIGLDWREIMSNGECGISAELFML
jgi:hypothetical protein